jgi:hypothetical protein
MPKIRPPPAPLPAGWQAAIDPASGQIYYQNEHTHATQWEPPTEAQHVMQQAGGNMAQASTVLTTLGSLPQIGTAASVDTEVRTVNLSAEICLSPVTEAATERVNDKLKEVKEWYAAFTAGSNLPEHDHRNLRCELCCMFSGCLILFFAFAVPFLATGLGCTTVTAVNMDGTCRTMGDCTTGLMKRDNSLPCPTVFFVCQFGCPASYNLGPCHSGTLGRCDCDDGYCWVYDKDLFGSPLAGCVSPCCEC